MRIASKISLADEDNEFDGKYLSKEQMSALLEYYHACTEPRRKEFLESSLAFHACDSVLSMLTLQWGITEKKELRKS